MSLNAPIFLVFAALLFTFKIGAIEKNPSKKSKIEHNIFAPTVSVFDTKVVLDIKISEIFDTKEKKSISSKFEITTSINKTNHFYLDQWHVEVPAFVFDKDRRNWRVDLRIYQIDGDNHEADEFIGTISLAGPLVPRDKSFSLDAKKKKIFKSSAGFNAYAIEVSGSELPKPRPVAKR